MFADIPGELIITKSKRIKPTPGMTDLTHHGLLQLWVSVMYRTPCL